MKLLLLSLGSRGDMDPFLAVGERFAAAGWEVVCAMPEQFGALVAAAGFRFHPLDRRFYALIENSDVQNFMGQRGSWVQRGRQLGRLYQESKDIQRQLIREQHAIVTQEQPDRLLFHPKCMYPVLWHHRHPGRAATLLPVPGLLHPLYEHPPIVMSTKDYGRFANKLLNRLAGYGRAKAMADTLPEVAAYFPEVRLRGRALERYSVERITSMYTVSPHLFTPPAHWPAHAHVVGYYPRRPVTDYTPPAALAAFLERHPKVLFVTFGSMVNADPASTTQTLLTLLRKHEIPTIINTFSGGLRAVDDAPDHVYFTESIPYTWILPKVYAAVHHGGSGTTHMAARSGCAQLLVPHIFDQYYWDWQIQQHGLGPAGLPIKRWTVERLEPKLLDLWQNDHYRERASAKVERMYHETNADYLITLVTGALL